MAALTQAERDSLASIIRTLEVGSAGKFISSNEIERLSRIFRDKCGFNCGCGQSNSGSVNSFNTGMRDAPFATLLKVILCGDEGLVTVPDNAVALANALAALCPDNIDLGAAKNFAVLAHTTVTNSGNTTVIGDLGLSPGVAVVGYPPGVVIGTQHITDAAAAAAKISATDAYNLLAALPGGIPVAGNIGGQTLTAGVYKSDSTLAISSGDLILDGQNDPCARFVFQVGTALTTTTSRKVVLINGTLPENVFWQMGSAFTLGADSVMFGTLIAGTSGTVQTEAFVRGRIFALTGQISTDTNVISKPLVA